MNETGENETRSMRSQILEICAEALRREGQLDATSETMLNRPDHARRLLVLLRDCRPLPVILDLIRDAEREAQKASTSP